MAAVNFTGEADMAFQANASVYPQRRFVFGISGQWRLDTVSGGGFQLRRKVSSVYQTDFGTGTVTNDDLKDLWKGLLTFVP